MKKYVFLIITFVLSSCNKDDSDESKYQYPSDFINPKNNVNIKVSSTVEEILEVLTNIEVTNQFNNCYDENGNTCKGFSSVNKKIFINFTNENKEISFLEKYEYPCECNFANHIFETLHTIPINQISDISILSVSTSKDINNVPLTTLCISPKFNSEVINYKKLDIYYDKKKGKYFYVKSEGKSASTIFFESNKHIIIALKNNLDSLIKESK